VRVVYVTSSVTYVPGNYRLLFETVARADLLPPGIDPVHALFLRVSPRYVMKNVVGLIALGAPYVGLALLRNLVQSRVNDPRKGFLAAQGIPYADAANINDESTLRLLERLSPDVIVNMRTRNIYRRGVLSIPKIGCINIHHGLLPENRGTMCDLWAWSQNRPVGFTIHRMNEKIDDGHILARCEVPVRGIRRYVEVPLESSRREGKVLLECLARLQADPDFVAQPNVCANPVFFRSPTPAQIVEIRRSGRFL
jgi:hypothetical protein